MAMTQKPDPNNPQRRHFPLPGNFTGPRPEAPKSQIPLPQYHPGRGSAAGADTGQWTQAGRNIDPPGSRVGEHGQNFNPRTGQPYENERQARTESALDRGLVPIVSSVNGRAVITGYKPRGQVRAETGPGGQGFVPGADPAFDSQLQRAGVLAGAGQPPAAVGQDPYASIRDAWLRSRGGPAAGGQAFRTGGFEQEMPDMTNPFETGPMADIQGRDFAGDVEFGPGPWQQTAPGSQTPPAAQGWGQVEMDVGQQGGPAGGPPQPVDPENLRLQMEKAKEIQEIQRQIRLAEGVEEPVDRGVPGQPGIPAQAPPAGSQTGRVPPTRPDQPEIPPLAQVLQNLPDAQGGILPPGYTPSPELQQLQAEDEALQAEIDQNATTEYEVDPRRRVFERGDPRNEALAQQGAGADVAANQTPQNIEGEVPREPTPADNAALEQFLQEQEPVVGEPAQGAQHAPQPGLPDIPEQFGPQMGDTDPYTGQPVGGQPLPGRDVAEAGQGSSAVGFPEGQFPTYPVDAFGPQEPGLQDEIGEAIGNVDFPDAQGRTYPENQIPTRPGPEVPFQEVEQPEYDVVPEREGVRMQDGRRLPPVPPGVEFGNDPKERAEYQRQIMAQEPAVGQPAQEALPQPQFEGLPPIQDPFVEPEYSEGHYGEGFGVPPEPYQEPEAQGPEQPSPESIDLPEGLPPPPDVGRPGEPGEFDRGEYEVEEGPSVGDFFKQPLEGAEEEEPFDPDTYTGPGSDAYGEKIGAERERGKPPADDPRNPYQNPPDMSGRADQAMLNVQNAERRLQQHRDMRNAMRELGTSEEEIAAFEKEFEEKERIRRLKEEMFKFATEDYIKSENARTPPGWNFPATRLNSGLN